MINWKRLLGVGPIAEPKYEDYEKKVSKRYRIRNAVGGWVLEVHDDLFGWMGTDFKGEKCRVEDVSYYSYKEAAEEVMYCLVRKQTEKEFDKAMAYYQYQSVD